MYKIVAFEENFAKEYYSKIENATTEQIEAADRMFGGKELPSILEITGNIANISITGPLSRKGPPPIARFFGFGGTGYNDIIEAVKQVKEDQSITNLIFHFDTPGGEAIGPEEVGKVISGCGKKTLAINHGMIASAGYWIASSCDKIKAIESSSLIGSVGVVITAVDYSKMYEEYGIKVVEVVSRNAPDKRPDIKKKSGLEVLQNEVDAIENVFMSNIAKYRNTTLENVRENYGRGALLVAQNPEGPDAIKSGMIDGLIESEYLISDKSEDMEDDFDDMDSSAVAENTTTPLTGENTEETMTLKEFLAQNPEAKAEHDQILKLNGEGRYKEGFEAGKEEVRARIKKVTPILSSDAYDKAVKTQAQKAINGEISIEAFESVVAIEDMRLERLKSEQATDESEAAGETPPEVQSLQQNGDNQKAVDDLKKAARYS